MACGRGFDASQQPTIAIEQDEKWQRQEEEDEEEDDEEKEETHNRIRSVSYRNGTKATLNKSQ